MRTSKLPVTKDHTSFLKPHPTNGVTNGHLVGESLKSDARDGLPPISSSQTTIPEIACNKDSASSQNEMVRIPFDFDSSLSFFS